MKQQVFLRLMLLAIRPAIGLYGQERGTIIVTK